MYICMCGCVCVWGGMCVKFLEWARCQSLFGAIVNLLS